MNYSLDTGISQDADPGQDLDGDGAADFLIIDFSRPGPRGHYEHRSPHSTKTPSTKPPSSMPPTGRAETVFVTPSRRADGRRQSTGQLGQCRRSHSNVGCGQCQCRPAADCIGSPAGETLIGEDDWSNIVLRFAQFGDANDGPRNVVRIRNPTKTRRAAFDRRSIRPTSACRKR
ncbi:MAG: hypothetical protein U1E63_03295 [Burkholderiales bacterium]